MRFDFDERRRVGLAAELKRVLQGEVRFDDGSRALYSTDSSNYRQVPLGVVIPRTLEDVLTTIEVARKHDAPVLSRGGGTSLAGQCCNVAIVLDMSKYLNRIIVLDPERRIARIEPGIVLDRLREAAEKFHLTFGPDPATHNHCTLGGMIGNNSCGVHSVYAGKTDDNVEELEVLTYRGLRLRVGKTSDEELRKIIAEDGERSEIYRKLVSLRDRYSEQIRQRYPKIPRRVSGYNLNQLLPENGFHVARALVGSEGTCVTILNATVRLVDSPPERCLVVLGYSDIETAGDHLLEVLEQNPIALEAVDDLLVDSMKKKQLHLNNLALLPDGQSWLFVEFGGKNREEAKDRANSLMERMQKSSPSLAMKLFDDPTQASEVWKIRESALGASAFIPGQALNWEGWEDSAVAPEYVGKYLRDLRKLFNKYEYRGPLYGHFGQGCIHTRINFDLFTQEGIQKFRKFLEEAADLVLSYGGSLSGEHGDGQSRSELLPKMFGNELIQAFREFKAIWDPDGRMNPGKIVDPFRIDENLRLGASYHSPKLQTQFAFSKDEGSFSRAILRCVGVGECRKVKTGVMCPSYMVTHEEKHSTRGRARMLFEMIHGRLLKNGWRDKHVKEALDLCLSCKGCKHDCPVEVDMATYKAEFLFHYYRRRLRPRSAYSMGLIYWWSRIASLAPSLINLLTQTPVLSHLAKAIGGIAQERRIPRYAKKSFRKSFMKGNEKKDMGRPRVILWPDTFNNYFHPEVAAAAVDVLESAGFSVSIPAKSLCCGRPLYDYGMLKRAKRLLRQILQELETDITAQTSVVVLEPSCLAVFRDELPNLFPDNESALRLSRQSFLLSEFLQKKANHHVFPTLKKKAVVQLHCHQLSLFGKDDEANVLKRLNLDFNILDSGCCGMAGSFGFEKDHHDISIRCGERVLFPAVSQAPDDTLIIADGFSCREQIEQYADRRCLHLAEVLRMAVREQDRTEPQPQNLEDAKIHEVKNSDF